MLSIMYQNASKLLFRLCKVAETNLHFEPCTMFQFFKNTNERMPLCTQTHCGMKATEHKQTLKIWTVSFQLVLMLSMLFWQAGASFWCWLGLRIKVKLKETSSLSWSQRQIDILHFSFHSACNTRLRFSLCMWWAHISKQDRSLRMTISVSHC